MMLVKENKRVEYPEYMLEHIQDTCTQPIFYVPSYLYKLLSAMKSASPIMNILNVKEAVFVSINIESEEESSKEVEIWKENISYSTYM